ncbi:hypothetical protein Taro_032857 [Colocasia esculenta]|uniref:Uncharacterized protein n=1 Tax=Colocasia esculenta TaxID=4460 RepID=A0A843VMC7_COLES|nr:hypothetical protein [Colocasia esculenta]
MLAFDLYTRKRNAERKEKIFLPTMKLVELISIIGEYSSLRILTNHSGRITHLSPSRCRSWGKHVGAAEMAMTVEALMYVLVPMPCLFFGGGSTHFLISRDGGSWVDAAKFMTGASAVGSIAIPAILRHANLIEAGAMWIEFVSFFILVCTVLCFHHVSLEEDW